MSMSENDSVLTLVQEKKNDLQIERRDFESKLSKVESLLAQQEELWGEVGSIFGLNWFRTPVL